MLIQIPLSIVLTFFPSFCVSVYFWGALKMKIYMFVDILLLIIIVFFQKMAETMNRKLRTRRPPAYLAGDVKVILWQNSDPELFGYTRTSFNKDFVSPAQELNSLAKLLSKFVNSANKRLVENLNGSQGKQDLSAKIGNIPAEEEAKKNVSTHDGSKRRPTSKTQTKDNPTKPIKDTHGVKEGTQQSTTVRDKSKISETNKKDPSIGKSIKTGPAIGGLSNINYMNILQQLGQQKTPGMSLSGLNRSQIDPTTISLEQQRQIMNYGSHLGAKFQTQHNFQARNQQSSQKCFRRSTYHIAIAYQIHLNNLKESGKDLQMPMNLDPTYPAKKLKGEFDRH